MPIEDCVEHLILLIIRTVETSIAGASGSDCKISKNEVFRFYRQGGARTVEKEDDGSSAAPIQAHARAKALAAAPAAERAAALAAKPTGEVLGKASVEEKAIGWSARAKALSMAAAMMAKQKEKPGSRFNMAMMQALNDSSAAEYEATQQAAAAAKAPAPADEQAPAEAPGPAA